MLRNNSHRAETHMLNTILARGGALECSTHIAYNTLGTLKQVLNLPAKADYRSVCEDELDLVTSVLVGLGSSTDIILCLEYVF